MPETPEQLYLKDIRKYEQMIKEGKIMFMQIPVLVENGRTSWSSLMVDPYTLEQIEKIRGPNETPSKVVEKLVDAKMKELGLW